MAELREHRQPRFLAQLAFLLMREVGDVGRIRAAMVRSGCLP